MRYSFYSFNISNVVSSKLNNENKNAMTFSKSHGINDEIDEMTLSKSHGINDMIDEMTLS